MSFGIYDKAILVLQIRQANRLCVQCGNQNHTSKDCYLYSKRISNIIAVPKQSAVNIRTVVCKMPNCKADRDEDQS